MENISNNVLNREKHWYQKVLNKKNFVILVVILILIFGLRIVIGGQKETQLPIPKFLDGAQIVFSNQMYYQVGKQQEDTKTFKEIGRELVVDTSLNEYYPNRFTYKPVSTSTMFSVVGAINNSQYGLYAIDSGTKGIDFLILQDEQGNKSLTPYFYLYTSFSDGIKDALVASYYKNGKRIDYIHESDFNVVK